MVSLALPPRRKVRVGKDNEGNTLYLRDEVYYYVYSSNSLYSARSRYNYIKSVKNGVAVITTGKYTTIEKPLRELHKVIAYKPVTKEELEEKLETMEAELETMETAQEIVQRTTNSTRKIKYLLNIALVLGIIIIIAMIYGMATWK
jgi:hypothetical protein